MNNINNNINKNVLLEIKKPSVFYPIIMVIIFLIIVLFCFLFKVKNPFQKKLYLSQQEKNDNVFFGLFCTLLISTFCIILLPNFKEVKKLFEQINVIYAIIYTVFFILFFSSISQDIINNYSNIIVPIILFIGAFIFYKSTTQNYNENFNINYERIKSIILLFCLISIFIFYNNIVQSQHKYTYSTLISMFALLFAFLYLIIVLTVQDKVVDINNGTKTSIFEKLMGMISYYSVAFLIFIVVVSIVISKYPGGFFNDAYTAGASIIVLLLICIFWSIIIGVIQFPEMTNNIIANDKIKIFKRSLVALFSIVISSLIIIWVMYNIQKLSGNLSIVKFVLNLIIVIIILGFIYKIINIQNQTGNLNKNNLFMPLQLFSSGFDKIGKIILGQYNSTSSSSLIIFILTILLIFASYKTPDAINKMNIQGGKQLVNKPVYTDTQYLLGNYLELNGSDKNDYTYAISFWIFIDAMPPNTNSSYKNYTSLLNFGDTPNVLYNGATNTLMITMKQKNLNKYNNSKLIDFDENDNRIIYEKNNMLLQKWNNVIINYSGGVIDVFLNGELVKSVIEVVPYHTIENLTIGQKNGIKGGICNVVYFRNILTATNIYYLYNMVKHKSPPVLNDSNETILN